MLRSHATSSAQSTQQQANRMMVHLLACILNSYGLRLVHRPSARWACSALSDGAASYIQTQRLLT